MQLDLDHYRTWIGREESASEQVTPELVNRFNATLDLGRDYPRDGDPVAPMIHFCLAPAAAPDSELGPDGHPARGGFLPPVPLPRRMWAGGKLTFGRDIRVGDVVQRVSRIESVDIKDGRTGTLCFVAIDHTLQVGNEVVVRERQDVVYRGNADASRSAEAEPEAETGQHSKRVEPTPPLLFRYSALTFNGHRIHYDHPYATQVEGYPGLVVHGPLQATLLVHFAASLRGGQTPKQFSFRSHSPLFDDASVELHANASEDQVVLWTARPGGPVALRAEAFWS
ncbi:MAG: MaoC family dehydratase N-terminal domain-containing protein [Pseudomonadota bacterium]